MRLAFCFIFVGAFCSCARKEPREAFPTLAREFVYTSLANAPVAAGGAGYHKHQGRDLDTELGDYSPRSIQRQRRWLQDLRLRMHRSIRPEELAPQERADYAIIEDQISLALLEFDSIQSYRHNPTIYVELIGSGLYNPFVLHYAPVEERYRHIVSRMEQVPVLLSHARRQLSSAPELWTTTAMDGIDGIVGLIGGTLRSQCPPGLADAYDKAAKTATGALQDFKEYLRTRLLKRPHDWRLGAENYAGKFRCVIATDQSPVQVLQAAEQELARTREQMLALSLPIYDQLGGSPAQRDDENHVIRTALDDIAKRHTTRENYFNDARRDLEEARQFVKQKNLLTLPARDNLQVIETPEFMRGVYSVGGFNPAPVLEPHLGAFYWLTPIPPDWPEERVASKLREYNYYGLKLLTIHEAMPGHYVQLEYANNVQPPLRRIVRSLFGNVAYIEGWAVYATEVMLDAGYLDYSPELRLTFLKQQLRMLANAILDVRLQTMGMTDEEALDLMLNQAFQEKEEAEAKLVRAKLTSAQLPTYFVGWRDWRRLRDSLKQQRGGSFSLKEFHEEALSAGAVPLPILSKLLSGGL